MALYINFPTIIPLEFVGSPGSGRHWYRVMVAIPASHTASGTGTPRTVADPSDNGKPAPSAEVANRIVLLASQAGQGVKDYHPSAKPAEQKGLALHSIPTPPGAVEWDTREPTQEGGGDDQLVSVHTGWDEVDTSHIDTIGPDTSDGLNPDGRAPVPITAQAMPPVHRIAGLDSGNTFVGTVAPSVALSARLQQYTADQPARPWGGRQEGRWHNGRIAPRHSTNYAEDM